MALLKGNSACTTGLSKRIYDNLVAGVTGFGSTTAGAVQGKAMAYAIACAVVDEITTNATVSATVPALGLVAPPGGGAVTGAAAGTGTVA